MKKITLRDGQYYYSPHRDLWGIWRNKNLPNGSREGSHIKDCRTKEEAIKEVYRLNGWKLKNSN